MLEGLEISEVLLSKLERTSRLDSEFYSKENLNILETLLKQPVDSISTLTKVSDGNHMSISNKFQETGIPYYRGQNIHSFFIEESDPICISNETYNIGYLKRSHLMKGDVLLSIVGTIGGVAVVSTDNKATCNCKLAILRPEDINGFYLSAFLKSKYGQNQIQKFKRGAVQMGLILEDMNQIFVPTFSKTYQKAIQRIIETAKIKSDNSKQTYSKAENLLLKEIGLQDFTPSKESVNIKSFKDSFATSGRLDAEYYQPFYEEVENIIKRNGFTLLQDICSDINYGTVPTSPYTKTDDGIPYIKGMNLKNTEIKKDKLDRLVNTEQLPDKYFTKKGDIIISQMGTVGDVGVIRNEENWLFASFTIRARLSNFKLFNPSFVGLYIQKVAKKYYLYRNIAQASVRQNTDLPTIRGLYLPNIDIEKQNVVAELIEQSFSLKKQSEHLLEVAKKAVEIAIEENEEAAIAYINNQSNSNG